MTNSDAIKIITKFVSIQTHLVSSVIQQMPKEVNELDLRKYTPDIITVEKCAWETKVHGSGITFRNSGTGEAVNVHVGILTNADAFDDWRLEEYLPSQNGRSLNWIEILENLFENDLIQRCPNLRGHFVL